jgi:WD40 repeat protein
VGDNDVAVHWRVTNAPESLPPPLSIPTGGLIALAIDSVSGHIAAVSAPTVVGSEQTVWVRGLADTGPPRELFTSRAMFGGIAFSPDGRLFAVADNVVVRTFRTDTWELTSQVPVPLATTCLAFSPDGRRLAAIGYDGITTLLDPAAGKRVFQLRSLTGRRPDEMAANARVAFSPDGGWLLSTNWDGSLNLWDGTPADQ